MLLLLVSLIVGALREKEQQAGHYNQISRDIQNEAYCLKTTTKSTDSGWVAIKSEVKESEDKRYI